MHRLTVCSLTTFGSVLALGACHHHAGARHGRGADLDRDHDERQLRDGDADHDEHGAEGRPDLGAGMSTRRAVHAIAKARCEREKRCENIGHDKNYGSLDACREKIEHEWAGDLNKYECPHGIVATELEQCLTDVRAEECGNPLDTLSRIAQCDADDICDGD